MVLLDCIDQYVGDFDTDPIDHWIEMVEGTARLGNWSDSQRCMAARLKCRGQAQEFLSSDPDLRQITDWKQLKEKLISRFKQEETTISLSRRMMTAKQQSGESARAFASRVQQIAVRLNMSRGRPENETERLLRRKLLESDVCATFLNGLKSEIRNLVRVQMKPESKLSEMVTVASAEESQLEMDAAQLAAVQFVRQQESSSDEDGSEGRRDACSGWQRDDNTNFSQWNN